MTREPRCEPAQRATEHRVRPFAAAIRQPAGRVEALRAVADLSAPSNRLAGLQRLADASMPVQRLKKVRLSSKEAVWFGQIETWHGKLPSEYRGLIPLQEMFDAAPVWPDFGGACSRLKGLLDKPPLGGAKQLPGKIKEIVDELLAKRAPDQGGGWGEGVERELRPEDLRFNSASAAAIPGMISASSSGDDLDALRPFLGAGSKPSNLSAKRDDPTSRSAETVEVQISVSRGSQVYQFVLHYHPTEEGNFLHFKARAEDDENVRCDWNHWLLTECAITRELLRADL